MAGVATGVANGVASAAASTITQGVCSLFFGNFNPDYKKEDQKRMRYIQAKYAQAYGNAQDDYNVIIQRIDPNSKLKMNEFGTRPANPFPDEKAFDESLELVYFPVSGHEGRFVASHALKCIGKIIEYQSQRRNRMWVPKVSSPGRPNDYINMFLEETKCWMRNQLTLDSVGAEELSRRDVYFTKLKHDNYYWCFPPETNCQFDLHSTLDYVHERIQDALEVVTREEKNKSLQLLFKELNDHATNAFEYGKSFMAFILSTSKKAGTDFLSSDYLDGSSIERGRFHCMLVTVTDPVMKSYVSDMRETDNRIEGKSTAKNAITNGSIGDVVMSLEEYNVDIPSFEENTLSATVYIIDIHDPKGHRWVVRKNYSDFQTLHAMIEVDYVSVATPLTLPPKMSAMIPKAADYEERAAQLRDYLARMLSVLNLITSDTKRAICKFLETKELVVPEKGLVRSENVPNMFVKLKDDFKSQLVAYDNKKGRQDKASAGAPAPSAAMNKDMMAHRQAWGVEWIIKIFDAYAMLQRMGTMLAWTLEINHFFVSMFGNTLAFSKLPLRDIIVTQKDILNSFLALTSDLFKYACNLNADQQYKWHKNLQASESQLTMLRHHTEKAIAAINRIDSEHLDYETQMRRLQDVASRFQPFMQRVDNSLPMIHQELNLSTPLTITAQPTGGNAGALQLTSDVQSFMTNINPMGAVNNARIMPAPAIISNNQYAPPTIEELPDSKSSTTVTSAPQPGAPAVGFSESKQEDKQVNSAVVTNSPNNTHDNDGLHTADAVDNDSDGKGVASAATEIVDANCTHSTVCVIS